MTEKNFLEINADELKYHGPFSSRNRISMEEVVGENEILFIDEAQKIPEIGINLKILHDARPDLTIVVTGSSSFDLANSMQEPLTGRTRTFRLYPISVGELLRQMTKFEIRGQVENYLLFGMYPEVLTIADIRRKREHLMELSRAYLYKDILSLANIRNSDKIHRLLQLLALQVGSGVSVNKLANALDLSHETVNHYIDLLEKSFVLYRLSGYSNNLSKEVSKMDKIYFYDTGIRNAILENFSALSLRTDKGALWENFIISERIKMHSYARNHVRSFYWRVYTGAEVDLVEAYDGKLLGYEIKASTKIAKAPKSWSTAYPDSEFHTINMDNWIENCTSPN